MTLTRLIAAIISVSIFLQACSDRSPETIADPVTKNLYTDLEQDFDALVRQNEVVTAGAAIITDGKIAWTGYFGEQAPGQPATANTQFNVGSVTKTVAAETILRLAAAGKLSLDAPMAPVWVDPDIKDDPRHETLTPRIALTHTTGFPNWRFFTADGKLSFISDPGTSFTYSGEGFEYLATYAEKLTGQTFDELVNSYIFDPIGITNAAYSIEPSNFDNIAQTKDKSGVFPGHYCYPDNGYCRRPGSSTPADDLVITVEDYAAFLISVMNSDGYGDAITTDRNTVHATKGKAFDTVICDTDDPAQCPLAQGYGLGWEVLDFGTRKIVAHGGSDWHELAIAYFDTQSKDGVIIFLNAPSMNALKTMPEALSLLDAQSPMIGQYRRWLEQTQAAQQP